MNEMILNHIKAYYHGVKDFKCSSLRGELGNKINTFKQRMKRSKNSLKINYLDQDISDDDDKNLFKLKRKRNNNDDDEKENNRYQRKVIIKSINEQRMVIIKKIINEQQEIIEEKFDHDYCDIMYDNEYEGLHLLHYSADDVEPSEEIEDLQQTIDDTSEIDIKPSKDSLLLSLIISNEEEKINQPG
jgi:hypothetical protein